MVKAIVAKIKKPSPCEESELLSRLSAQARQRLLEKKDENAYTSALCALFVLSDLASERGISLDRLAYTKDGRPYFEAADADISISHSRNYVACAISDSADSRVGIDVEDKMLGADRSSRLAERFFTPKELAKLAEGADFLEIWTKKEALFKRLAEDSHPSLFSVDSASPEESDSALLTEKKNEFTLSVCFSRDQKAEIIIIQ